MVIPKDKIWLLGEIGKLLKKSKIAFRSFYFFKLNFWQVDFLEVDNFYLYHLNLFPTKLVLKHDHFKLSFDFKLTFGPLNPSQCTLIKVYKLKLNNTLNHKKQRYVNLRLSYLHHAPCRDHPGVKVVNLFFVTEVEENRLESLATFAWH